MTQKIIDGYRIVRENSIQLLTNKVNRLIDEAWTPMGGITIEHQGDADGVDVKYYYQVMVFEDEVDSES